MAEQQIVYVSDNNYDCMPVTLPVDKITTNTYPFVVDAPEGLTNPKFDWSKGKWIEQDVNSQAKQLADLKDKVTNLQNNTANQDKAQLVINQQLGTIVQMLSTMSASMSVEQNGGDK